MKAILLVLVLFTASCSSISSNAINPEPAVACAGVKEKYGRAIADADREYRAAVANQVSAQPDPKFINVADAAAIAGEARARYDHCLEEAACMD
jgi:hypothetical protein